MHDIQAGTVFRERHPRENRARAELSGAEWKIGNRRNHPAPDLAGFHQVPQAVLDEYPVVSLRIAGKQRRKGHDFHARSGIGGNTRKL